MIVFLCLMGSSLHVAIVGAEETKPTVWVTIYQIQGLDTIEMEWEGGPDWLYRIEVWDGNDWLDYERETTVPDGILVFDRIHDFILTDLERNITMVYITLFEKDDFITLLEVADISSEPGFVNPNQREPSNVYATFMCDYNLATDTLTGDEVAADEGYYKTSGEYDGSIETDENDAELWFLIWDNYELPIAEAGEVQTVETGEPAVFNGTGSTSSEGSSIVKYEWDFDGDGVFDATGASKSRSFAKMGDYTVTLRITDSIGATDEDNVTIQVLNREPLTSFGHSPIDPTVRDVVTFLDASTDPDGEIVSWLWDFGDGETSTAQNSTHIYSDKGTYAVELMVTDDDGGSHSTTMEVTVVNLPPAVDFRISETTVNVGDEVMFTDLSSDPERKPLKYLWDFGDGNTSTGSDPTHVYSISGTMTVRLTVIDDEFEAEMAEGVVIVFPRIRPVSYFRVESESATVEDELRFYDESTDEDGYIVAWQWEFGDGETSTRRDSSHRYWDKGIYYATLVVIDDDGNQDSVTRKVTIENLPPAADFAASEEDTEVGEEILFTDRTTDPEDKALVYAWDFGDGSTSSQKNPGHEYNQAGTYTVELTVTDDEGETDVTTLVLSVHEAQTRRGIPGFPLASIAIGLSLAALLLAKRGFSRPQYSF